MLITKCAMSKHYKLMFKQLILWMLLHCCCADLPQESTLCDTDGVPVCATNANDFMLFPNECMLEETKQLNYIGKQDLQKTNLRNCLPMCDIGCPRAEKPICAISKRSGEKRNFLNSCEMAKQACLDNVDWEVIAHGKCFTAKNVNNFEQMPAMPTISIISKTATPLPTRLSAKKRRQPIKCKDILRPVCASFAGVKSTFKNECLVNAENVRTGKSWEIFTNGICEEDYANLARNTDKNKKSIQTYSSQNKNFGGQQQFRMAYEDELSYIVPPTIYRTEIVANRPGPYPAVPYMEEITFDYKNITKQLKNAPAVKVEKMSSDYCQFGNNPTCGISQNKQRTFKNLCELIMTNINTQQTWSILHEGACLTCDFNCPSTNAPICVARNGFNITMSNQCVLRASMCEDRRSTWSLLHKGACQSAARSVNTAKPNSLLYQHKLNLHKNNYIEFEMTARPMETAKTSTTSTVANSAVDKTPTTAAPVTLVDKLASTIPAIIPASTTAKTTTKPMPAASTTIRMPKIKQKTNFNRRNWHRNQKQKHDNVSQSHGRLLSDTKASESASREAADSMETLLPPVSTTEQPKRISIYGHEENSHIMILARHKNSVLKKLRRLKKQ